MDLRLIVQFSAMEAFTAMATASRFSTGSAPGIPRQTGQVCAFAGAPNFVEQPQKIFECVSSWQCTSSPMTGSYFCLTAFGIAVVAELISIATGAAGGLPF